MAFALVLLEGRSLGFESHLAHVCRMGHTFELREASLVAQTLKNLPAIQATQVWPLGWEDPWRREWQPPPVFLPGESHGQKSLMGYSPWGHTELDTTEWLTLSLEFQTLPRWLLAKTGNWDRWRPSSFCSRTPSGHSRAAVTPLLGFLPSPCLASPLLHWFLLGEPP